MTSDRVAVVLMAYGTPRTPEEIEPYYTDIRRGRPPTPEALADLVARYAAIGGVSPLAQLTEALETHRRFRIAPSIFHVTTNISRLLLQLCRETDEEPSWLGELLPALREMNGTPGTWKQRVLSQTRHHIEEGAEGNAEAARERLQRLLDDEEDREVVAESWYWIWKLRVGKEERAREEAERLYTELFADRPMKRYR